MNVKAQEYAVFHKPYSEHFVETDKVLIFFKQGRHKGRVHMKYCINCGRALADYCNYCYICGAAQPQNTWACSGAPSTCTALVPVCTKPSVPARLKGQIPILVWSLILVPLLNIVGTPLAAAAAILCVIADSAGGEEGYKKLDTALYLCIIATVFDAAFPLFAVLKAFVFH